MSSELIDQLLKQDRLTCKQRALLESALTDFVYDTKAQTHDIKQIISNRFALGQGTINLTNDLTDEEILRSVRLAISRSEGAMFSVSTKKTHDFTCPE